MNKLLEFNDFLLDMIFENKIELNIVISDRLYELLSKIDHPITHRFFQLDTILKKSDKATLIDIDDDKDNRFTYTIPSKLMSYVKDQNIGISDDNFNSSNRYFTAMADRFNLWTQKRTPSSVGKIVNKIFPNEFESSGKPGKDIESFTNMVISERKKLKEVFERFKIVSGKDINKYYNEKFYDDKFGPLSKSCMKYDRCEPYIDFYSNSNSVKMVVLMSENYDDKIIGRALLWDIVEIDDEEVDRKFMDRIYVTKDSDIFLFKDFAKKNGWLHKNIQNVDAQGKIVDTKTGESDYLKLKTKSDFKKNDTYPYMDTLKYFYFEEGFLSNFDDLGENKYFLEDIEGKFELMGYDKDLKDYIYVPYYGRNIDPEELTYCNFGGEYRLESDAIYLEYYDEFATSDYVKNNMRYSSVLGDYFYNRDLIHSNYLGDYIPINNSFKVFRPGIALKYSSFEDLKEDDYDDDLYDYVTEYYLSDFIKYKDNYFFNFSDRKIFVDAESLNDGKKYKMHKIWDKDKLLKYNNNIYIDDNEVKKDNLIGQYRLFDNKKK